MMSTNDMTTDATADATTDTTVLKRHPIRGFLYGIVFGLGLMMIVVGQGWAALGTWPPFIVFLVGLAVGTLWGLFGPAKKPKGPPPPAPIEVDTAGDVAPDHAMRTTTTDAVVADAEPTGGADSTDGGDAVAGEPPGVADPGDDGDRTR